MASEESDDEPLAVLAAAKKLDSDDVDYQEDEADSDGDYEPRPKKKKTKKKAQNIIISPQALTIHFGRKKPQPVIQRPEDVWLYLKDFNPAGPYSCLLCNEWFISKSKIIIHYVLNHKKDYCGICRYFVADRDTWEAHMQFHTPWPCSQCGENFPTALEVRQHLSSTHNLVHCRLCHFRVPADEQYEDHLLKKHNVSNMSAKEDEIWEMSLDKNQTFMCNLCSKTKNLPSMFFSHYMGYHHFTIKCITSILGGRDTVFTLFGADITRQFVDSLQDHKRGYVELDRHKTVELKTEDFNLAVVKEEVLSDNEVPKQEPNIREDFDEIKTYKGDQDFDVTSMEIIVLEKNYFDYLNHMFTDIESNAIPVNSNVEYDKKEDLLSDTDNTDFECSLCKTNHDTVDTFAAHICKMHSVKSVPIYSCRVCATTFDGQNELESHIAGEMGGFQDLWICQFCDKEFEDRTSTRSHLSEHKDILEADNCFSPHIGFKCRYCHTLFWNEVDREQHQIEKHFVDKNKANYYQCECDKIFSDKVWFTYHFIKVHQVNNPTTTHLFKCCICCKVLPSVSIMRGHFESEHPHAKKVFCSLESCKYRPLSHKKSFQLHLRSQHRFATPKDVACSCAVCGREFPNAKARNAHTAAAHGPGKYKCTICKAMLHSIDERKLHYLLRHPGKHPFTCNQCGKSFLYKSSLYMHKKDHATVKQDYTCNYCHKVFAKKDSFREHLLIHEGPRHACSYCPMRFVQRSNMLRHERRHTGERPYACPHCDRTFADKGACTSHQRTHTKDASYTCLYCGQTFAQKSKLTYHIRRHTGENLETCPICSKLFTSACSLREHMKTHEAKKRVDVKCPLCDRTYQDERYMLRHIRCMHTGNPHTCPLCDKQLSSATGLRHHVLTHSQRNMFWCKCCPKSYAGRRTIVRHLRRRHGLKGSEINVKDFYKRLDPRECQINLDEETMTTIFGQQKEKPSEIIISDFVSFPDRVNNVNTQNSDEGEETAEENDESEHEIEQKYVPNVLNEANECELEPTDFVSVKIEPLDE